MNKRILFWVLLFFFLGAWFNIVNIDIANIKTCSFETVSIASAVVEAPDGSGSSPSDPVTDPITDPVTDPVTDSAGDSTAEEDGKITLESPFGAVTFDEMINRILSWLWPLSGAIAVLMILVGAYYLVLSGGSPEKIATGKKIIIYALIGFAIITISNGIISLVRLILGIE